jgi:hypothetical protein
VLQQTGRLDLLVNNAGKEVALDPARQPANLVTEELRPWPVVQPIGQL